MLLVCVDNVVPKKTSTTRKPEKTNGITDGNIQSVVITDELNSVSKSDGIYDGLTPSEIRSVYTDGNIPSVYTDRISDGLYILFGKMQRRGDVEFVQTILPMEWPRDSNWDSRTVTWHCHRWNHRRNISVGDSIGKNHYIHPLCRHSPLFLLLLLSHPTSPLPNCSQPPIPTLHYFQHKHSSFLYLVRGHNIRFLWILLFFCK